MRLFLVICFAAAVEAGLLDPIWRIFGSSENKDVEDGNKENVHVINPDSGQLTELRANPNLGDEIKIPRAGSENPSEGKEIYIPSNRIPIRDDRIMQ